MAENVPQAINVTDPEMLSAVQAFSEAVVYFDQDQVLAAITSVEAIGDHLDKVLPLTRKPEETGRLFASWRLITSSGADVATEFDEDTEAVIEDDERVKEIITAVTTPPSPLDRNTGVDVEAKKRELYREFRRMRFAIFGGRLAAQSEIANEGATGTEGS